MVLLSARRPASLPLLAALAASCDPDRPAGGGHAATVRDRAGATIVESQASLLNGAES